MNINERFSVVLTVHDRLSTLKFFLGSVYKNSRFRDHEIILVADRIDDPCPDEWLDIEEHKGWSVRRWLKEGEWFSKLNIQLHERNCPKGIKDMYRCWNYGAQWAKNKWLVVVMNDDYYMCPDWDYNVLKHLQEYDPLKYVFVSAYIHIVWFDHVEQEYAGMHYYRTDPNPQVPVYESNLLKFFEERKKQNLERFPSGVFIEQCGDRHELMWVPIYVHKDLFWKVDGFQEEDFPSSCDLHFDDSLRDQLGIMKVGCLDSFFVHNTRRKKKGMFVMNDE